MDELAGDNYDPAVDINDLNDDIYDLCIMKGPNLWLSLW